MPLFRPPRRRKTKSKGRSGRRRLVLAGIPLGIFVVSLFAFAGYRSLPEATRLAHRTPRRSAFMARYARRTGHAPDHRPVPLRRIHPHLAHAVIVAEDIGFLDHNGFSASESIAALSNAIFRGRGLRGASTLTQQLAKNLWLSPERSLIRKLKEAILTLRLESALSKRRILELYLNFAEFGPGLYGAEAAAQHHYGHSAAALSIQEAAALAAVLSRPRRWQPGGDAPGYAERIDTVVRRMEKTAWIPERLARYASPATPNAGASDRRP